MLSVKTLASANFAHFGYTPTDYDAFLYHVTRNMYSRRSKVAAEKSWVSRGAAETELVFAPAGEMAWRSGLGEEKPRASPSGARGTSVWRERERITSMPAT